MVFRRTMSNRTDILCDNPTLIILQEGPLANGTETAKGRGVAYLPTAEEYKYLGSYKSINTRRII